MIYLPKIDYPCYVVQDMNTIRAYHIKPYNPGYNQSVTISYTDYYINSHYLTKDGTQNFSYSSTLPTCLAKSEITDDFYYRNDLPGIMIIFLVFVIFAIYLPIKLFSKLFRKGAL